VQFASGFGPEETADDAQAAPVETAATTAEMDTRVHVTARRSEAQVAENAVLLRGRTEALRDVDVASETSGRIISEPLRAGAFVEEGTVMCEIDPGTRMTALAEAEAALDTARARLPEAEAQLAGAQAQLPRPRSTPTPPPGSASRASARKPAPPAPRRRAKARWRRSSRRRPAWRRRSRASNPPRPP
jgi:multidrug efflux system membrane fusion protein